MGRVTPDKPLFDEKTAAQFVAWGWQGYVVGVRGPRWFAADVLALKEQTLAIAEVKTDKEDRATWNWADDCKNLSPRLTALIGKRLGSARQDIVSLMRRRGSTSRAKLYAVTVGAQLFRYFHEFEERAADYEKCARTAQGLLSGQLRKVPYLVVPATRAEDLAFALEFLCSHGVITSFKTEQHPSLLFTAITYT